MADPALELDILLGKGDVAALATQLIAKGRAAETAVASLPGILKSGCTWSGVTIGSCRWRAQCRERGRRAGGRRGTQSEPLERDPAADNGASG